MIPGDEKYAYRFKLPFMAPLIVYVWALLAVVIVTLAGKSLLPLFDLVNIALLYLLPILIAAIRWGIWPSLLASFLGILSFWYFFVPPVYSLLIIDIHHLFNLAIFLVVAITTGTLASRLRNQAEAARERERRTALLHSLSAKIAAETDLARVLDTVVETVSQVMNGEVTILMPDASGMLSTVDARSVPPGGRLSEEDAAKAQSVFSSVPRPRVTGGGLFANCVFVPVYNNEKSLAVIVLRPISPNPLNEEQQKDLEALANLAAIAITRTQLHEEAEQVKWLAESEKLHRSLLNAVSHDLRTPLSSITGAVTGLLLEGEQYDAETRQSLLRTIKEGAGRMNRFVTNLLDMARIESGILRLNREYCDIQDIAGVVLKEVREMAEGRKLLVTIPGDIPPVEIDFGLIEQVMINLMENSIKYSPPESPIDFTVKAGNEEVTVEIGDFGPAIPEGDRVKIFDKFYRLRSAKHVTGTGLGLSICRNIVEAHGGRIWVEPRPEGGNTFAFSLPLGKGPSAQPDKEIHGTP